MEERVAAARDPELRQLMDARADRSTATTHAPPLTRHRRSIGRPVQRVVRDVPALVHDRSVAERHVAMTPRRDCPTSRPWASTSSTCRRSIRSARTHRKGRNNALTAAPGDPGSPWAIGSTDGGHTPIEPGLGTLDDFDRFVAVADRLGLEVALDIAFQASPDHPWVREHPAWFRHRPDGSIKYAENPPKKYQDIYPFDFESRRLARALGRAARRLSVLDCARRQDLPRRQSAHQAVPLLGVVHRARSGASIPDVDLPRRSVHPSQGDALPGEGRLQPVLHLLHLAQHAAELREYLTELTTTEVREYMRPNFFANTPDILHEYLQHGGRPAFEVRLILAATLSASYGIYSGFELCENVPVRPGSEEYLDSEKYQIKVRDWSAPGNLKELIARVERHPARAPGPAAERHAARSTPPTTRRFLWFSKHAARPGADDARRSSS